MIILSFRFVWVIHFNDDWKYCEREWGVIDANHLNFRIVLATNIFYNHNGCVLHNECIFIQHAPTARRQKKQKLEIIEIEISRYIVFNLPV